MNKDMFMRNVRSYYNKILAKIQFLREKGVIDPDPDRKSIFWLYNFFDGLLNYLHIYMQNPREK